MQDARGVRLRQLRSSEGDQLLADGTTTVNYDANDNRNNGSYTTGTGNRRTADGPTRTSVLGNSKMAKILKFLAESFPDPGRGVQPRSDGRALALARLGVCLSMHPLERFPG